MLERVNRELGTTVAVITHNAAIGGMADRVVRGAMGYKTLLIWPYAVAPAVAGVLYAFLFAPSIGTPSPASS